MLKTMDPMVVNRMGVPLRPIATIAAMAALALGVAAVAQDAPPSNVGNQAQTLQDAFDAAISAVRASVVGIIATRQPQPRELALEDLELAPVPAATVEYVMGAGFVADRDGWVITSTPLVADSAHVEVLTERGASLPVLAIHYDRQSDVAALRVDLSGTAVPPVTFRGGDVGPVAPGHWAIVVGPTIYGMPISSVGHVTAPYLRVLPATRNEWASSRVLMFTSVPRVPMGEGAPVVDIDGRVIGMALPAGQATSLDDAGDTMVAVTTKEVQAVFDRIRSGGAVKRPWMGIQLQDIPIEARTALGAPDGGAYIVRVTPGGPAATAGVHVGDVLVAMSPAEGDDTVGITGLADLGPVLDRSHPGDRYRLSLVREGQRVEADITLGVFPESAGEQPVGPPPGRWGMSVRVPSADELAAFDADHGLLAEAVEVGQGAFLLGIRPGDLLMRVGDTLLRTPADLAAALEAGGPNGVVSIAFRRIDGDGLGSYLAAGSPQ